MIPKSEEMTEISFFGGKSFGMPSVMKSGEITWTA
jgi:hypothetical protein